MEKTVKKLSTYVRPEIVVCEISTSNLLAASGDPSISNPSMGWDTEDEDIS